MEFQKWMRMKGAKSGVFHGSGCEYIQKWMRMVSEYTEEDANGFAGRWARALWLLCAFKIGPDSDSGLGSNLGNAVLIHLKLLLKVEFDLPSALDLEVD